MVNSPSCLAHKDLILLPRTGANISASKTEDLQGSFNFGKFNRRGTSLVDGKYEVLQQQKNSTTGTSHD